MIVEPAEMPRDSDPDTASLSAFEREGIAIARTPFRELTRAQKVAQVISLVVSPNLTAGITYGAILYDLYISTSYQPGLFWPWLWFGIYIFSFNPLVLPVLMVATKKASIDVADRRLRFWPFLWSLAGYGIFFAFAGQSLGWDAFPVVFLAGAIALTAVVLVISTKWKISVHMTGNAVAFCGLAFYWPVTLAVTLPLHGVVAAARYGVKAHTPAQLAAGTLLGFSIPALVIVGLLA